MPSDSGTANTPIDLTAPPTLIKAIEVPVSDSSNASSPAMFAAVSAENAGWRGASLFVEQGSTLASIGSTNDRRAVIGSLASTIGSSACMLVEPTAFVEIDLPADDLFFESSDLTGLAMGSNRLLIGDEVMQFLKADPMGGQRWKLSGLLRGRAGTEEAAGGGHGVGTMAVLLNDRLTELNPSQVQSAAGTRIAAIGRADNEPVFADLQNAGLSLRPPSPVHPRLNALVDGSWELCWTRRARGQWGWPDGSELPLVEEQETYTVSFGPSDAPHTAWSVAEPRFVISLSERANLLATFGPESLWVRQLGTFGQSRPRRLASIT